VAVFCCPKNIKTNTNKSPTPYAKNPIPHLKNKLETKFRKTKPKFVKTIFQNQKPDLKTSQQSILKICHDIKQLIHTPNVHIKQLSIIINTMTNELTTIEQELPKFLSIEVVDQTSLQEASTYLIGAKKEYKAIKADMDSLLDPIKETIEGIKAKYDPRLKALKSVIDALSQKTTEYQTSLVNAKLEAESKITAKVESGYIKPETAIDKLSNLQPIEKSVTTEVGGATFVEYPQCEVEDITKVPMEYHEVDMVKVRALMKSGTKLPGIRYWTEQRLRNKK